jgi:hypothetical protein
MYKKLNLKRAKDLKRHFTKDSMEIHYLNQEKTISCSEYMEKLDYCVLLVRMQYAAGHSGHACNPSYTGDIGRRILV